MRLKIELNHSNQTIPFNYNYPLSAALFHAIRLGNPSLSNVLHNLPGQKFCFSELISNDYQTSKRGITFFGKPLVLYFDSENELVCDALYKGLNTRPTINLYFNNKHIELNVSDISQQSYNFEDGIYSYKTLSPILQRKRRSDLSVIHLHPNDPELSRLLVRSIQLAWKKQYGQLPPLSITIGEVFREKLIALKNNYKAKCYHVSLQIEATWQLHKFVHSRGLGNLRSQGLGMIQRTL